jgi:hypothetical protein
MIKETVLYRIKPVYKKSIEIFYEAYKETEHGNTVGWSVRELYRWGQGFVESEDELPYIDDQYIMVDPIIGDGCELDDNISVDFTFDPELSAEITEHIETCWCDRDPNDEYGRCNAAWLYDASDWQVESESVTIYGPFEVDKLTYLDYNLVSTERIELKQRPARTELDSNTSWPFPKD